jgi:threonine/homoserine/homoserine lactone efflux protein
MFERFLTAATDLPVIVQGALGSALFALVLFAGQHLSALLGSRFAKSSRKRRKVYLIDQQIKYNVLKSKEFAEKGAYVSLLVYRASRSLFKSLIWLTLGFAFGTMDQIFGLVGYLGCLYYLFKGLNTVTGPESVPDVEAKLQQIKAELEALNEA